MIWFRNKKTILRRQCPEQAHIVSFIGGSGGGGHYPGGEGATGINCTTGGTAGEYAKSTVAGVPGISHNLFCGAGGYSADCDPSSSVSTKRQFAGPGGKDGNGSIGRLSIFILHIVSWSYLFTYRNDQTISQNV